MPPLDVFTDNYLRSLDDRVLRDFRNILLSVGGVPNGGEIFRLISNEQNRRANEIHMEQTMVLPSTTNSPVFSNTVQSGTTFIQWGSGNVDVIVPGKPTTKRKTIDDELDEISKKNNEHFKVVDKLKAEITIPRETIESMFNKYEGYLRVISRLDYGDGKYTPKKRQDYIQHFCDELYQTINNRIHGLSKEEAIQSLVSYMAGAGYYFEDNKVIVDQMVEELYSIVSVIDAKQEEFKKYTGEKLGKDEISENYINGDDAQTSRARGLSLSGVRYF